MFYGCSNLQRVDVTGWKFNDFGPRNMFYGCSSLTEIIGINEWDVSKNKIFQQMFRGCSSLEDGAIDLSGWITSSATDMLGMFNGCTKITTLDIGDWDVSNVTTMQAMFSGTSILSLDIGRWNVSKVQNMSTIFQLYK